MCVAAGSREQGQDDEKMSCTAAAQRVDVLTRAGGDLRPVQRSSARVARRAKAPGASADGGEPNVPHRQDVGSGTVCDSLGPAGRVCARPPAANDRSDRLSWRCPPPPPARQARARARAPAAALLSWPTFGRKGPAGLQGPHASLTSPSDEARRFVGCGSQFQSGAVQKVRPELASQSSDFD